MTTYANRLVTTVSAVASAGLGAFTVSAASSGYRTFVAGDDGKTFDVTVVEGTAWEVRTGCAYTHSGTSLARGTLEASSTGSAIAFTSAAVLTVTPTAAMFDALERTMAGLIPGGRLTLESGVPVSTTDQTAKTTIYYTPYVHNVISLWDGVDWVPTTFAEKDKALGTLSSGKPYDVFAFLSSGVLDIEFLVWTDDTTRATAVTLQDGRYCKSGDKTRLLLGTFYTASTTTTADSKLTRYIANVYNRVPKTMDTALTAVSNVYASATFREWNNGTSAVRLNFVQPIQGAIAFAGWLSGTSANAFGGVGIDSTSVSPDVLTTAQTTGRLSMSSNPTIVGPGKHYAAMVQYASASVTFNEYQITARMEF